MLGCNNTLPTMHFVTTCVLESFDILIYLSKEHISIKFQYVR